MARQKEKRFAETKLISHFIEAGKPLFNEIKGNWHEKIFTNRQPISLELACGRGEYTIGLAEVYPNKNFVGIDIKGDRMWKGSTHAREKNLENVAFLRTKIQSLADFFSSQEVADIWIINPDPRPKNVDIRRRLTNPRFLAIYQHILQPDGYVRLKTDNDGLFEYTLEVLQQQPIKDLVYTTDLYHSPLYEEHHNIKTRY